MLVWLTVRQLKRLTTSDMSEENKNRDDDRGKRGGDFRVPPRTWIIWIAILGSIPLLMIFRTAEKSLLSTCGFEASP